MTDKCAMHQVQQGTYTSNARTLLKLLIRYIMVEKFILSRILTKRVPEHGEESQLENFNMVYWG